MRLRRQKPESSLPRVKELLREARRSGGSQREKLAYVAEAQELLAVCFGPEADTLAEDALAEYRELCAGLIGRMSERIRWYD